MAKNVTTDVTTSMPLEAEGLSQRIRKILEPRFIHFEPFADALALALATRRNVWFFGDGGYGKSHMLETAFAGLGLLDRTYIQAFGQGMTPERLVGNLDLKVLNEEGLFRFNVHESFLVRQYAIFEEMPDAAIPVLFLLKDTLERRCFRDGVQQVPMQTETIVVNSNRAPAAVAEYGVDAAALIQRWGFEQLIRWPTHGPADYEALLTKQAPHIGGPDLDGCTAPLARLLASASERGEPIPPRIALEAVRAVKGRAMIAGRKKVETEDFAALQYVRGLQILGKNVEKEVADAVARAEAQTAIKTANDGVATLLAQVKEAATPIAYMKAAKKMRIFLADVVMPLVVTDELVAQKTKLAQQLNDAIAECHAKAEDCTTL